MSPDLFKLENARPLQPPRRHHMLSVDDFKQPRGDASLLGS